MASEVIYPNETNASQSYKLVRLARTLRSQWVNNPDAEINVYGYINAEAAYSSTREKSERASMRQRMSILQDTLKQMGIPKEKAWIGGITFSSNRGGQIDLFIRVEGSAFILPPYPPTVGPAGPKEPSGAREPWFDSDAEIGVDPEESEVEVEIGVKYEGDPFRKIIKPNLKFLFKSDGSLKEIGTEMETKYLKVKIAERIAGFRNVEISAKPAGSIEFSKGEAERLKTELHAKLKVELEAELPIPKTKIKMPVKLSVDVDPEGKLGVSALVTIIEF